jgi:hypothetical protein
LLFGVWAGFVFGLAQYAVLRRHLPQADLWPIAGGVGWLGAAVSHLLVVGSFAANAQSALAFLPADRTIYWAVGWVAGALVYGLITGVGLVWMLRQPPAPLARNKTAPLESLDP